MKKRILIIDKPENCCDCDLEDKNYCIITGRHCESGDRPKWCPLCDYDRVIPVGWFNYWLEGNSSERRERTIAKIIRDWEKQNSQWEEENEAVSV